MTEEYNSASITPESLELADNDSVLVVAWEDGVVSRLPLSRLRAACTCAVCQGHHPSQSLNLRAEQFPDIRITDLAPVGRYAYHIVWSDGHNSGIFTLRLLRELSEPEPETPKGT
jgi:DUF971 family protein